MKNVLIYKNINIDLECNINTHYNNDEIPPLYKKYYKNHEPNTGNKVWFQGIVSEVSTPENKIHFLNDDMNIDYINNNFDLIIYPMANIFGVNYKEALNIIAEKFEKIKIPTYVISCGVQAKNEYEIDNILDIISESSKRFITSIYNTGGQFALRGNITNLFFNKLGFSNAGVVGCPSLYQKGRNIEIDTTNKVTFDNFKAVLNGNFSDYIGNGVFQNNKCTFIDQDTYSKLLFDYDFCKNIISDKFECLNAIKYYGYDHIVELCNNHIQLFFETNLWYNYLIKNKFIKSY